MLYSPAIITLTVFSLINITAQNQNMLIYNLFGWVNLFSNNLWGWFYIAYYSTYTITSIILIADWQSGLKKQTKPAASFLIAAFLFALVFGSSTDIILVNLLSTPLPELAPVFVLIPVTALYYGIRKHNLIKSSFPNSSLWSDASIKEQALTALESQSFFKDENDLSSNSNKLTVMLMVPFLFTFSIINFGYFTILSLQNFNIALANSLIVLGLAFCFIAVGFIKNTKLMYRFITLLFVCLQVFLYFAYYDFLGPAIWTASYIYILLALYQPDKTMLAVFAATVCGLGIYTWTSKEYFTVSTTYYIAQFVLFTILFFVSSLVLTMNSKKSIRIREQMKQQALISEASKSFLTISNSNFNEKVTKLLEQCGNLCEVDRSYLFLFSEDLKTMKFSREWCANGIKPAIDIIGEVSMDTFPWCMNKMQSGKELNIPDVELLSGTANKEKEIFKKQETKSILSFPVANKERALGFLGFDAVRKSRQWNEDDSKILRMLANILSDALIKLTAEREIHRLAYYDDLTGMPNRRLLLNRIKNEILISKDSKKSIGIMYIDLDYFKNINDTMGHTSGDELLKHISSRLSDCITEHDTVCRFGGDEYLLLFANLEQPEDILKTADRIMKSFDCPFLIKGQEFYVSISAGIAMYPNDGEDPDTLIKNADLAMYSSKNQGKNRYTLCSPVLKEEISLKTNLTHSLYKAQQNNELQLYYQPQINITTKDIVGVEALLRWNNPQMGMIMPNLFIPLAEQTGLINSIGEWVIKNACAQCSQWHKRGASNLRIAVNLSLMQIQNPNIVDTMQRILDETGLDSKYLEIEITESIACKSNESIIRVLNELKSLGTTISIDDFGVEYSSLNRLKRLPVDRIKVDMQFIHSISQSDKDDAIVKIIVQLGKNLGLSVIAEGVETEPQLNFLTTQLCDEVQGYYFYKPMPSHEMEQILFKH